MIAPISFFDFTEHGGNIYYYAKKLGLSPFELIDLSSSANPLVKNFIENELEKFLKILEFYPDPEGEELKKAISRTYGVKTEHLVLGNGSYELLQWLILSLPSETVFFLLEPTFVGYRKILQIRRDIKLTYHISLDPEEHLEALEKFLKRGNYPRAVLICNPANPTGTLFTKRELSTLIETYEKTYFIVDEAFIEFVEGESLLGEVEAYKNLFVFRSFSKFYGLAGARIGYLGSQNPYINHLKKIIPTWSANSLSQYLAKSLILNSDFKKVSLEHFKRLKNLFEKTLDDLKVSYFKSFTNFYLIRELPRGKEFFFWLLKEKHILVRPCYNFLGLTENDLRVSLKDEESLNLFLEALREWVEAL
jgi:threonine-phosphate decarboxylase